MIAAVVKGGGRESLLLHVALEGGSALEGEFFPWGGGLELVTIPKIVKVIIYWLKKYLLPQSLACSFSLRDYAKLQPI